MPGCPHKEKCVSASTFPKCICTHTSKIDRDSLSEIDDSQLRRTLQTYRREGDEQS